MPISDTRKNLETQHSKQSFCPDPEATHAAISEIEISPQFCIFEIDTKMPQLCLLFISLLLSGGLALPCCKCANYDGSEWVNCCGSIVISGNGCTCNGDPCLPCTPAGQGECTTLPTTLEENFQICTNAPACCTVTSPVGAGACCVLDSLTVCVSYYEGTLAAGYAYNITWEGGAPQFSSVLAPTYDDWIFAAPFRLGTSTGSYAGTVTLTVPSLTPPSPSPSSSATPSHSLPSPPPSPAPSPCPPGPDKYPVWLLALAGVLGAVALGSAVGLVIVCYKQKSKKGGYSPLQEK